MYLSHNSSLSLFAFLIVVKYFAVWRLVQLVYCNSEVID